MKTVLDIIHPEVQTGGAGQLSLQQKQWRVELVVVMADFLREVNQNNVAPRLS